MAQTPANRRAARLIRSCPVINLLDASIGTGAVLREDIGLNMIPASSLQLTKKNPNKIKWLPNALCYVHPNLEKSARTLLHRSLGSSVRWPLSPNFFSLHCIEKDLSGEGQS